VSGGVSGVGFYMKVDIKLLEKGNSNSHGARPVHQIMSVIKWLRTSRLSIKNFISVSGVGHLMQQTLPHRKCSSSRFAKVNSRTDPSTFVLY
jgi:hypothetical protein